MRLSHLVLYIFHQLTRQVLEGRDPDVGFIEPPLGSKSLHCITGPPYSSPQVFQMDSLNLIVCYPQATSLLGSNRIVLAICVT